MTASSRSAYFDLVERKGQMFGHVLLRVERRMSVDGAARCGEFGVIELEQRGAFELVVEVVDALDSPEEVLRLG